MRISVYFLILGALLFHQPLSHANPAQEEASHRPYGMEKRVPWTSSNVKGTPDPADPYRTERVFPKLKFNEPLDMTRAPGTDRLFVVERYGKIYSFPDEPSTGGSRAETAELFVDLDRVLYGLAFHPRFTTNGYVYITSVLDPKTPMPLGSRVSRFKVDPDNPFHCDPSTEVVLIEWPSGGHNGGCLKFGPDGYLYIVTGDASEIADGNQTGQDLSDLPGSVLRIDVDRRDAGKTYRIPDDNPFVDVEDARPEVWAYGLRQLWKMSFDRATGDLWGGNVGQDLWEMIFVIERGGNYGWSVTEGSHPFRPERERGPTPIIAPIVEHNHTEARSITGGYVYHGSRLKELAGAYIYGDYDTGLIWALRYDGSQVTFHQELVDSSLRLVGFAEDRAGELYLLDHMSGGIYRLAPNPATGDGADFPRKLSETGLFASVKDHKPAPGVIPYTVIAPNWDDGAVKERFLALPGNSKIDFDGITYPQPAPGAPHGWKFPDGTVAVQTLSLEMETGNPASRRRLETRILHHERLLGSEQVGDQVWQGYTYLWNEAQTEAVLLESKNGKDQTYTITDPSARGGKRQQTWHFPSRAECIVCHNMAAKYVLGVNTLQMNKFHDYGGVVDNQLRAFEHIGLFTKPPPKTPEELPRLVDSSVETENLDRRARSYIHANCSHCHRKWGGGNAEFLLLASVDLADMGIVDVRPAHGTFQMLDARLVAPGDPYRSVLFYRMAKLASGRMPRLGSGVVDERGLDLISNWIASLPARSTPAVVARQRSGVDETLSQLRSTAAPTEATRERIDRLLTTSTGALKLSRALEDASFGRAVREEIVASGSQHPGPQVRDLFERFLPEEKRTKRLGSVIDPAMILALEGSAARGRSLFFDAAGVQCKNCHKIQEKGSEVGPDLSEVGKKYPDRSRLLETILEPSKEIDPKYVAYIVQTSQGEVYSGLIVKKTDNEVVLKDAANKVITLSTVDVELLIPQQQSLMPDLLLRDMTAAQVADLVTFLGALK